MYLALYFLVSWLTLSVLGYYWLRPPKNMRVYLICPVRNISPGQQQEIEQYVYGLEINGYVVHYPPRDVEQNDPTGVDIVLAHRQAMKNCGRVDIFWDVNSSGSHFDIGMAIILGKKLRLVKAFQDDSEGKSYLKVIQELQSRKVY